MRILVTGGAGFIGSHLVERFQGRAEIRVLDDLRTGHRHNLEGLACELVVGSILDQDLLREVMDGVDYVFHLAAMVSVPESMADPLACARVNTEGTLMVLDAAARAKVKKLCFSSSSAVYGERDPELPRIETMPTEPLSPYGASKLAGEDFCRQYARAGWLATACLRYFNVFGPRQDPNSQYAAVVPAFITRALRGVELTIYGDGEQTRDFIFVRDIAGANEFLSTSPAVGVFNVANGRATTVNELARMICAAAVTEGVIRHAEARSGDIKYSLADITALTGTGFRPAFPLATALAETIASYRARG